MRTYARIQSDVVAELFTTSDDVNTLFHQHLIWVDVTASPKVQVGWLYHDGRFEPPSMPAPESVPNSLLQLQGQLASLAEQLAALARAKS